MIDATTVSPPSLPMIVAAGSITPTVVALVATQCKRRVAAMEHDLKWSARYQLRMLSEWLQSRLTENEINQSDLARHLTKALGRSIDRAAVNKMVKGSRQIQDDEALAIFRYLDVRQIDLSGPIADALRVRSLLDDWQKAGSASSLADLRRYAEFLQSGQPASAASGDPEG